jgi:hypothetical protein
MVKEPVEGMPWFVQEHRIARTALELPPARNRSGGERAVAATDEEGLDPDLGDAAICGFLHHDGILDRDRPGGGFLQVEEIGIIGIEGQTHSADTGNRFLASSR